MGREELTMVGRNMNTKTGYNEGMLVEAEMQEGGGQRTKK